MSNVSPMFVVMKKAIISVYNSVRFITATFQDVRANGYNPSNIITISPYGQGSYPVPGIRGLLIPDQDSNKNAYYCTGFSTCLPPGTSYTPAEGESWAFSLNYMLTYQNTGLIAYRVNDNTYHATLPSGEWMGVLIQDRIDEIEGIISEVNTNITALKTWAGLVNGALAALGQTIAPLVQTNLTTPTTLANDTTVISNNEYLITDDGTLP